MKKDVMVTTPCGIQALIFPHALFNSCKICINSPDIETGCAMEMWLINEGWIDLASGKWECPVDVKDFIKSIPCAT